MFTLDGVEPGDDVVLWNGGLWPWLDPFTAIRAAALAAERRPRLRLVFMGAAPQLAAQRTAELARELARELGVLDRVVHFNDHWVPYERRGDWLTTATLRALHPRGPRRDALRVPDAPAGLLLGAPPGGLHLGR